MPEPRRDETQDEWMDRCMGDSEAVSDFPDEDQRAAFCTSRFSRLHTEMKRVKANMDDLQPGESVRREVHEGVEHVVVPAVLIVEGVLNGCLVTAAEFGRHVESWNGIPVPVLHPEQHGEPISANRPDIIEKNTIGRVYNAYVDGNRLKAELWINMEKARRLGYGQLLDSLAAGEVIEISTGYFADSENKSGEYNGVGYTEITRNIRPDHLALLPGEIGACSVADGCGTRTNKREGLKVKVQEAFNTLAQAVGLRANCQCEDGGKPMSTQERAEKIKALADHLKANKVDEATVSKITKNAKLSPEQIEMLMGLDAEQLKMAMAFTGALMEAGSGSEEPEEMEQDEEMPMANNSQKAHTIDINGAEFKSFMANELRQGMRRERVLEKLQANEANAFDDKQLQSMSIEALETYEQSIRPADYSGQGGFAGNSSAVDTNVTPLVPKGLLAKKKEA